MTLDTFQKNMISLFIFFLAPLSIPAIAVEDHCVQVLSQMSPIWVKASKSPGFQTLRQEGNPEFYQAVGKAINTPNIPKSYQDQKGRIWEIVYDSNPSRNDFNFNISRTPFLGLKLSDLNAVLAAKTLEDIARRTGANSPPAVAMVREGDFPYYEINPKHIKGTPSFNNARSKNPALIPSNHIELYRKAIADNKGDYWSLDETGNIHRFQTTNWTAHWNGATQLKKPGKPNSMFSTPENPDPIDWNEIPVEVRRHFGY